MFIEWGRMFHFMHLVKDRDTKLKLNRKYASVLGKFHTIDGQVRTYLRYMLLFFPLVRKRMKDRTYSILKFASVVWNRLTNSSVSVDLYHTIFITSKIVASTPTSCKERTGKSWIGIPIDRS